MKRMSQERNVGSQWTQGWNVGKYGKLLSTENIETQDSDWRTGYLIGVKERQDNQEEKRELRKKRLLSFFGYSS